MVSWILLDCYTTSRRGIPLQSLTRWFCWGIGAVILWKSLPRYLHKRRHCNENRPDGSASTGSLQVFFSKHNKQNLSSILNQRTLFLFSALFISRKSKRYKPLSWKIWTTWSPIVQIQSASFDLLIPNLWEVSCPWLWGKSSDWFILHYYYQFILCRFGSRTDVPSIGNKKSWPRQRRRRARVEVGSVLWTITGERPIAGYRATPGRRTFYQRHKAWILKHLNLVNRLAITEKLVIWK